MTIKFFAWFGPKTQFSGRIYNVWNPDRLAKIPSLPGGGAFHYHIEKCFY